MGSDNPYGDFSWLYDTPSGGSAPSSNKRSTIQGYPILDVNGPPGQGGRSGLYSGANSPSKGDYGKAPGTSYGSGFGGGSGAGVTGSSTGNTSGKGGPWDMLSKLFLQESDVQQKLADEQWQRNEDQTSKMEGLVGNIPARISAVDKANRADTERAFGRLDKADEMTMDSLATMKDAISKFQDTSAQDMSLAAKGISQNINSEFEQFKAESDWASLNPEEQAAKSFEFQNQKRSALSQTLMPMASAFNQQVTALRQGLSQMQAGAAQAFQQGAQLEAGIREFNATASKAAVMDTINMQLQGRTAIAAMVAANPKAFVSRFSGLLALYAAQSGGGYGGGSGSNGNDASAGGTKSQIASSWRSTGTTKLPSMFGDDAAILAARKRAAEKVTT